MTNPAVPQDS